MLGINDNEVLRRPLGLTLLTALYLFFFLLSASTFGNPFPFMGHIYQHAGAQIIVFVDSIICLYLFIGMIKRQFLTWYLVIGYNFIEIVNTTVNLSFIPGTELEKVLGKDVNTEAIRTNNIALALAILLLTQYIYRHKDFFTNRRKYLF